MKVAVTGGNGFIGQAVGRELVNSKIPLRMVARSGQFHWEPSECCHCGDIGPDTDWSEALRDISHVVHLAARVHRLEDGPGDSADEYHRVNTLGTERLARSAARAGVQRFIYLSTAKVHGEGREKPYGQADPPQPQDPYARSKWEAEKALRRVAAETGMEIVTLRPPLVYGPGVKGNFLRLLEGISRGYPLPLGRVQNRRSLLYVGNLAEVVTACLSQPAAADKTFLVSDGDDLSSPELVRIIAAAMDRPTRLLPVPVALLRGAARICGKNALVDRLVGSFCIDSGYLRRELHWRPTFSLSEGLQETVRWFLQTQ